MVSGVMISGIVTAFIVCTVLVLASFVLYFKKRSGVNGTLFVLLFGMMGVILAQNIADLLAGFLQLQSLMKNNYVLAMALYAILLALVDMAIRMYSVSFIERTGIGRKKAITLSCGYVSGLCLMPMFSLFGNILYAVMINQGTFLDPNLVGTEEYQQMEAFQKSLISGPGIIYYVCALEYVALAVMHSFLSVALVRGCIEKQKAKSFWILLAIRGGYEVIRQVLLALSHEEAGAWYSENTALILSAVISIGVIAGGIVMLRRVFIDFPEGNETMVKQTKRRPETVNSEEQRKRLAWQEIRNMNLTGNQSEQERTADSQEGEETQGEK